MGRTYGRRRRRATTKAVAVGSRSGCKGGGRRAVGSGQWTTSGGRRTACRGLDELVRRAAGREDVQTGAKRESGSGRDRGRMMRRQDKTRRTGEDTIPLYTPSGVRLLTFVCLTCLLTWSFPRFRASCFPGFEGSRFRVLGSAPLIRRARTGR